MGWYAFKGPAKEAIESGANFMTLPNPKNGQKIYLR
jgi:hypothetical protein